MSKMVLTGEIVEVTFVRSSVSSGSTMHHRRMHGFSLCHCIYLILVASGELCINMVSGVFHLCT